MRIALALVVLSSLLGCARHTAPVAATVPKDRAAAYIDGIAKARGDECRATYDLIVAYREAAVPIILKALELYADPAKAPRPQTRIVTAASWAARLRPSESREAVVQIMRKASGHPNPEISSRAKAWLQANDKGLKPK